MGSRVLWVLLAAYPCRGGIGRGRHMWLGGAHHPKTVPTGAPTGGAVTPFLTWSGLVYLAPWLGFTIVSRREQFSSAETNVQKTEASTSYHEYRQTVGIWPPRQEQNQDCGYCSANTTKAVEGPKWENGDKAPARENRKRAEGRAQRDVQGDRPR